LNKLETAVQIAQSSSICSEKTELLKLVERSYDAVLAKLQQFKGRVSKLALNLKNHSDKPLHIVGILWPLSIYYK
jgi:hypothetical protein